MLFLLLLFGIFGLFDCLLGWVYYVVVGLGFFFWGGGGGGGGICCFHYFLGDLSC